MCGNANMQPYRDSNNMALTTQPQNDGLAYIKSQ